MMLKTSLKALAAMSALAVALAGPAAAESLTEKVPSGTYEIDKTHGYITFSYNHLGFSKPVVAFDDFEATLTLDADAPTSSSVDVKIDAASIDSGVDIWNEHLNSADWFDTAENPEITFVSTGLTQADDATGTLTGDLTIKGVTKPVTLDVTLLGAGNHPLNQKPTVGIDATTTVLRSEFGMGAYVPAVSDEITITISGEFNRVEEEAPSGS
ncbi:MAG: YceI family protein [Pseudomonadota bacterium]